MNIFQLKNVQNDLEYLTKQLEQQQKVVYVRRNLTVAEVIVVFVISCGLVFGIQAGWNFATNVLPKIEIKVNQ